jgi:hypothetical protein
MEAGWEGETTTTMEGQEQKVGEAEEGAPTVSCGDPGILLPKAPAPPEGPRASLDIT